jgi:RHS repeat-associated protein
MDRPTNGVTRIIGLDSKPNMNGTGEASHSPGRFTGHLLSTRDRCTQAIASLGVCLMTIVLGGCWLHKLPAPRPGIVTYFEQLMVPVPGGLVNASGGNLHVQRDDISLDTRIGEWSVGAVWNSATGKWLWNFDMTQKLPRHGTDPIFTDDTGATFFFKGGSGFDHPFGGSHWIRQTEFTTRTLGGLFYHFDASGDLTSVNWMSEIYPALHFNRSSIADESRLMTIEQCRQATDCSTLFSMSYDNQNRLVSVVDLSGRTSRYTYDGQTMRIATARDPLDIEKGWPGARYEYDEHQRLVAITNSHNERVEYRYVGDATRVHQAIQIGESNPTWAFNYRGLNQNHRASTTVLDPLGTATKFVFDNSLRLWKKINAAGEVWAWVWRDDSFSRYSETSPAGLERYFIGGTEESIVYDARGNEITTTFTPWWAENRDKPFERAVERISDNIGLVEHQTYHWWGELESISNGSGDITTYSRATIDDLTITDPAGVVTTYTNRGEHGHYLTKTVGTKSVNYTYDLLGNLLTADDLLDEDSTLNGLSPGQGGIVARSYDADRNLSALTLEAGGMGDSGMTSEVQIQWRADHQYTSIIRPHGGDTEFEYDELGRLIAESTRVDGEWSSTQIEYDAVGRTTALLKANGMATRTKYGNSGEIVAIQTERDSTDPNEVDGIVEFQYESGRIENIRGSIYEMTPEVYSYDNKGLIDEIRYPGGEMLTFVRDDRGRMILKELYRSDSSLLRTFEYDYDLANRVTAIREDGDAILNLTYTGERIDETHFGNGVELANDYDALTGAITGFTASDSMAQIVATMDVVTTQCDIMLPASRCITEKTDSWNGLISTSYSEYQFEDQGSERLLADSYGWQFPTDSLYDYDNLSTLMQSPHGTYTYNAEHNRLIGIEDNGASVADYSYDEAGYVIERNGVPITWNGIGRVASIGADHTMQWDTLGRKVSMTAAGVETHWKYGTELTEDEFGNHQMIDLGWVVSRLDDSTHEYRLFDFRGNAKLLMDDEANVTAHHHYAGFQRVAEEGGDESGLGFAGGFHVDELVLLGARVLDPIAGRFLSRDPIYQMVNQYTYTLGNPVRFWDPSGETLSATPYYIRQQQNSEIFPPNGIPTWPYPPPPPTNGGSHGGRITSGRTSGSSGYGFGLVANPGATGCGIGFEMGPLLLAWFAARSRCR